MGGWLWRLCEWLDRDGRFNIIIERPNGELRHDHTADRVGHPTPPPPPCRATDTTNTTTPPPTSHTTTTTPPTSHTTTTTTVSGQPTQRTPPPPPAAPVWVGDFDHPRLRDIEENGACRGGCVGLVGIHSIYITYA